MLHAKIMIYAIAVLFSVIQFATLLYAVMSGGVAFLHLVRLLGVT
jgi:hypothetical protein